MATPVLVFVDLSIGDCSARFQVGQHWELDAGQPLEDFRRKQDVKVRQSRDLI